MTESPDDNNRNSLSRRTVVKGAAWAAPAVATASAAPSVAASPCPTGNSYVLLYSPPNSTALIERPGSTSDDGYTIGNCTTLGAGTACRPTAGYVRTSANAIGLSVSNINIQTQNTNPVTLTLSQASCCTITRVVAHLHRYGSPTSPDCPNPYCQQASPTSSYFPITAGALNTKSVTVNPNRTNTTLCPAVGGTPARACTGARRTPILTATPRTASSTGSRTASCSSSCPARAADSPPGLRAP